MISITRGAVVFAALALMTVMASTASAASPARVRDLTCTDGTTTITFTGEQVRHGGGRPPHTWRNVDQGAFPTAFTFHAVTMTDPDGHLVPSESWDNSQGVDRNKDLVTCSFVIPEGPLKGHLVVFEGFFVP